MEKGLGDRWNMPPEIISFQGPVLAKTHNSQKPKAPKIAQDPMTARTALWGRCNNLHKQGRVFTPFHCSGACRIRPFHRGLAARAGHGSSLDPIWSRGVKSCAQALLSLDHRQGLQDEPRNASVTFIHRSASPDLVTI